MGAEIGDPAARVVVEVPVCPQKTHLIERHPRGGTEIEVPVQSGRRVGIRLLAWSGRHQVGVVPDADEMDVPKCPALDDLGSLLQVRSGAVLRTRQKHRLGACRGSHHGLAFKDVVPQRLLDIDVLAGLERCDGGKRVPVVGRRDVNCIDVLVVQHPAIVLPELADAAREFFASGFGLLVVNIAKIAVFDSINRRGLRRHALAAAATSDERDAQAGIRPRHPGRRGRSYCRTARSPQEVTPLHPGVRDVGGLGRLILSLHMFDPMRSATACSSAPVLNPPELHPP